MSEVYKYFRFLPHTEAFRSQIVTRLVSMGVEKMPRIFLYASNGELAGVYGLVLNKEADEDLIDDYFSENDNIQYIEEKDMEEYRKQYESIDADQKMEKFEI